MSLIVPPFGFAHCTSNLVGTPPAPATANMGTLVATGGSNADGSAVSILSALAHDVHYLVVGLGTNTSVSGTDSASLMDVLVDPAGGTSWASLIDDLVCGFMSAAGTGGGITQFHLCYHFPLFIKAGSSLGARARAAPAAVQNHRMALWAFGEPSRPDMWWCGQQVESLGINAASSKGTDITPTSTSATFTWTNVGGITSGRYGAIQVGQNGSDNASTGIGYYMQIGVGGARLPGTPTSYWANNTSNVSGRAFHWGPIWCDIPQGTQLQIGACASGAAEVHDVALYGVH